jgi:hypothetical protein
MSLMNEFDPYQELVIAKHNVNALIQRHNQHDQIINDLAEQHVKLTALIKAHGAMIDQLRRDMGILVKKLDQDK